nr:division/cell wall cluster transcriptional repressor MraZ [Traorella massiliensis]
MFMGEFSHNLDAKGRLIIPARFRSELKDGLILTQGLDGCLTLYTSEAWEKIYAQLQTLPTTKSQARAFVRILTSKACEVEIDSQGRILIPANLIKQANIKKECVVVGAGSKVEIWAKDVWEEYISNSEESFEELAESLTEFML